MIASSSFHCTFKYTQHHAILCTNSTPLCNCHICNCAQEDCNRIKVFLRDILEVDSEKMIIRTEPLVDMRYMTRYLVPKGFQLAIQVT
jgi:hypothetical protein